MPKGVGLFATLAPLRQRVWDFGPLGQRVLAFRSSHDARVLFGCKSCALWPQDTLSHTLWTKVSLSHTLWPKGTKSRTLWLKGLSEVPEQKASTLWHKGTKSHTL